MGGQNHKEFSLVEQILELLDLLQANHIQIDQLIENGGVMESLCLPDSLDVRAALNIMKFMDEMPGGFLIYLADEEQTIVYANRALLQIYQCDSMREFRELTGNSFRGMVHPDDFAEVERSIWEQVSESRFDLDYVEYRIIRKDGAVRWIEDHGHFVRSKTAGNSFYVFLSDATDKRNRRQAEEAQRERQLQALIQEYKEERSQIKQEHLRRLEVIEGLSVNYESILYVDLTKDTIFPYRLSSRTQLQFSEDAQTRPFREYMAEYARTWAHPEDRELLIQACSPDYIRRELTGNPTFYVNYRAIENGQMQYLQLRFVNVGGKDISQIVLGCRRMDEEVQHEIEQKQLMAGALNNAKLAIVAKNTFLSNMSHDMRTPLNAIFGFTALAKKNLNNAAVLQGYLEKVEASSRQLLDLIDKVLEIAWSESREAHSAEDECDIRCVMEEVYEFLHPHAEEKDIQFSLDCSGLEHRIIYSDEAKLKQLVLYLANNAVTYTKPGGSVFMSVSEREFHPNHYALYQITVADTGIGINKDFISRIFEPFSREKNTTLSGIHGTGLGLTIAKNIVDLLGGTIEASSSVGKGSTFVATFHFHVRPETLQASAADNAAPAPAGKTILLVEDNEINQEIETELLQELGFTIESAADGRIAVEMVEGSRPGYYDLILMDIQMPFMDGWQAARTIRKLENPALAGIPIIALSANVFESDVRTSMECGMDAHLAKPIDIPLLLKTMEEVQRKRMRCF